MGGRVQVATKQIAPAQPLAFQFVASPCYCGIPLYALGDTASYVTQLCRCTAACWATEAQPPRPCNVWMNVAWPV